MSAVLAPTLPTDAGPDAFAQAVGRAEHGKERVVLTRDGRPVAARRIAERRRLMLRPPAGGRG